MSNHENSTFVCLTSYTGKRNLTSQQVLSLIIMDIFILVLNFSLNLMVILTLYWSRQVYTTSLKLILYLSISDCCIALIPQMIYAVMLIMYASETNCTIETMLTFTAIFFTHVSGYIICLIGFDRLARIKYMTKYSTIVTEFRIKVMVVITVVLSLMQAVLYVLGVHYSFFAKAKQAGVTIDFIIAFMVLLSYVLAVKLVREYRKSASNHKMLKGIDQVMTALASKILLSIVICYFGYVIITIIYTLLIHNVKHSAQQLLEYFLFIGYILAFTNSFVNAVVFLSVNKKARKSIRRKFTNTLTSLSVSGGYHAENQSKQ